MTHVHVYVAWSTREWPLYLPLAWNVQYMHMLYVKYWILCTTLHTLFIKESALFKLAFAIFNSSFHQFNSSTSATSSRCASPLIFNMYSAHTPTLTTFNPPSLPDRSALVSWGGSPIRDPAPFLTWTYPLLCRRGRRARQGPLFHRPPEAKRSTAYPRHSLEILPLRIEAIGTC